MSKWYSTGLHFECLGCGRCCSGPGEGYIWVERAEIEIIAHFLKMPVSLLRNQYLQRRGFRTTIIEQPLTKDCIFLRNIEGEKRCLIYPVRPNQCRAWPFWSSNLISVDTWNEAAQKCPGINRGELYTHQAVENLKRQKKWWGDGI
jgi:Fe-S-cluster containining protein